MNTTKNLVLCALFAALIVVGTYIKIPTPLLPLTLQTMFVVLSGLVLGKKFGPVAVLVYILAGFVGLPAASSENEDYEAYVAIIPGACLAGYIAEKFKPCFITWTLGALGAMAVIYALGIPYYYLVSKFYLENELGAKTLLIYFVLMPMPGDIIKSIAAGLITGRLAAFFPNDFTWKR